MPNFKQFLNRISVNILTDNVFYRYFYSIDINAQWANIKPKQP